MKRILFVNSHREIGGGEIVLINLLKSMDRSLFDGVVVSPDPGPFQSAIETIGYPVKNIRMSHSRGRGSRFQIWMNMARFIPSAWHTVGELVRLIRNQEIDIIHAGTFQSLLYSLPAARQTNKPVVWHCHEFYLYGRFGPRIIKKANHTIATSHALRRNLLEERIDPTKVTTVHCSVDPELFSSTKPFILKKLIPGWEDGDLVFTTIGRLVPFKGQDIFLHAARAALRQCSRIWFLIVGGPLFTGTQFMKSLQSIARELRIDGKVMFTGQRDDVPALVQQSNVIVLPSRAEPFGISALEGMMAGKPVIVTNSSGVSEVVSHGNTGWVVPPLNPEILADAFIRLTNDTTLRTRLGESAKTYAGNNFTPSHMARKIERVLADLS